MNEREIKNLRRLVSEIDVICLCLADHNYAHTYLKDLYEPFYSDQMIDVVKRGCFGRFKHSENVWAGHCFVGKKTKRGHFKILIGNQEPSDAIWGQPTWSENFSLSDDKAVEKAINMVERFNNLKAFW
jgi:hypothetical protein